MIFYILCNYHDIQYDTFNQNSRLSNEFFSGVIAQAELSALAVNAAGFAFADNVRDLIETTQHHKPQPHLNIDINTQHIFLDADMSILGETPDRYKKYSYAIICEYSPDGDLADPSSFYKKRKEFLLKTLENKPIFYTSYMQTHYEEQAHINIRNEIAMLDKLIEEELAQEK